MLENDNDVVAEIDELEGTDDLEGNMLYQALTEDPPSGEEDDDEGDEFDGLEPEEGDSEKDLRTKLTAKNRILRQRGVSNKRLKDRVDELETQMRDGTSSLNKEDIKEILAASGNRDSASDDEDREVKRIEDLKEQLTDDPTAIVDILKNNEIGLENRIAKVLQDRDAYWEAKLSDITKRSEPEASPEVIRLVGLLRQKDQYKDADEATLISFAKELIPMKGRMTGKRPPATTSGRVLPADATTETVDRHYASELDKMGYGQDEG